MEGYQVSFELSSFNCRLNLFNIRGILDTQKIANVRACASIFLYELDLTLEGED